MNFQLAILADPKHDPVMAARWSAAYLTEFENLLPDPAEADTGNGAEHGASDQGATSEDAAVRALLERWIRFAPLNADALRTLCAELPQLGYRLKLSDPRGDGGARTYVRVLREDGKSAGYLTSTSFMFVGTRHDNVVKTDPRVEQPGRYPYIKLNMTGALELILEVLKRFLR
jgi:hypothetical protein